MKGKTVASVKVQITQKKPAGKVGHYYCSILTDSSYKYSLSHHWR